jgi:hypothetical protein
VRSEYCVSFGWNEADDLIGHSSIDTHSVTVLQFGVTSKSKEQSKMAIQCKKKIKSFLKGNVKSVFFS